MGLFPIDENSLFYNFQKSDVRILAFCTEYILVCNWMSASQCSILRKLMMIIIILTVDISLVHYLQVGKSTVYIQKYVQLNMWNWHSKLFTVLNCIKVSLTLDKAQKWEQKNCHLVLNHQKHTLYKSITQTSQAQRSNQQAIAAGFMIERLPVGIPAGVAGEFSSPESALCADSYLVSVPPHVTAVARKTPQSFCQKCRWQVTHKHAYALDPLKSE